MCFGKLAGFQRRRVALFVMLSELKRRLQRDVVLKTVRDRRDLTSANANA
jgi:hypothetical protein